MRATTRGDRRLLDLWRTGLVVGTALMLLLGLTLVLAFVPLGGLNEPVSFAIALAKALLVALIFMKLARSPLLLSLAALAGLIWLGALFLLTFTDFPFRLAGERIRTDPGSIAPCARGGSGTECGPVLR